jgi:hypothetical protein
LKGKKMDTIKVDRNKLLMALAGNRDLHIEAHEEALEGYRERLIIELQILLEKAEKHEDPVLRSSLTRPESHETDYDRIITMVEWNTDKIIELDEGECRQYLMDDWQWKPDFMRTQVMYAKKKVI